MKLTIEEIAREWKAAIEHQVQDKRIPSISYALVDREGTLASGHATSAGVTHAVSDESVFRRVVEALLDPPAP